MTVLTGASTPSGAMELPRAFAMFDDTIRRIFSEVLDSAEDPIASSDADSDAIEEPFSVEIEPVRTPGHRTAAGVFREFAAVAARSANRSCALTEMVRMIANFLEVDACSLFVLDDDSGELVLAATMGLNQNCVGRIRMKLSQGLVGLVAQELQPVFVENAPKHRRFRLFPELGEEPYTSFFGVPVLLQGSLQGVLVVQTIERRNLSLNWPVMATAARRIAPFVKEAMIGK